MKELVPVLGQVKRECDRICGTLCRNPKRSRPRDRDRKGLPHVTGRKVREDGQPAGAGHRPASISASRETCQHRN